MYHGFATNIMALFTTNRKKMPPPPPRESFYDMEREEDRRQRRETIADGPGGYVEFDWAAAAAEARDRRARARGRWRRLANTVKMANHRTKRAASDGSKRPQYKFTAEERENIQRDWSAFIGDMKSLNLQTMQKAKPRTVPKVLHISGATGPFAKYINGAYDYAPAELRADGAPVYKRRGENVWLFAGVGDLDAGNWIVGKTEWKNARGPRAYATSPYGVAPHTLPHQIPKGGWRASMEEKYGSNWKIQPDMIVVAAPPRAKKADRMPLPFNLEEIKKLGEWKHDAIEAIFNDDTVAALWRTRLGGLNALEWAARQDDMRSFQLIVEYCAMTPDEWLWEKLFNINVARNLSSQQRDYLERYASNLDL